MNWKRLQLASFALWLSLHALVAAQITPGLPDHPSHRYLPPPSGNQNLLEQISSLQQLSHAFGSNQESPAPLELSPAQLKQLDAILESFRDEKGELKIPSPDQVPKQWIDSLLPDPKQRQQAREMLEEYARSRGLPQSNQDGRDSSSNRFDANVMPTPSPGANQEIRDPFDVPSSTPFSPNANRRNERNQRSERNERDELENRNDLNERNSRDASERLKGRDAGDSLTAPNGNRDSSGSLPQGTPPELLKLYETLKQFQQQRAQQQRAQQEMSEQNNATEPLGTSETRNDAAANARSRTSPTRPGTSPRSNTQTKRNERLPGDNTSRNNMQPNSSSRDTFRNGPGSRPGSADGRMADPSLAPDEDNGANGESNSNAAADPNAGVAADGSLVPKRSPAGSSGPRDIAGGSNQLDPEKTRQPDKPKLTPFDPGYDFSADQKAALDPSLDPFAEPKTGTQTQADSSSNTTRNSSRGKRQSSPPPVEPFNVTRMSQQPRSSAQSSNTQEEFDLKKSVNELGLGPVLQRIVQKTIQERGFDSNQTSDNQAKGKQPNGKTAPSSPESNAKNGFNPDAPSSLPGPQTTEQLTKWARSVAASPNSTGNNTTAGSNSQWGQVMREIWKAVADAPTRGNVGRSNAAASPAAGGAASLLPESRWTNSMTVAVIVVATLIGILFWFSRKRVAELADASAAQAEWVRTVISQGLKNRADVVRAFHHLVKQSRSVSDWWTHRSIVKHFSSQTPQLASAISELALVYEQARYFPDDVELSPQQLAQVRELLESVKIPTSSRAQ